MIKVSKLRLHANNTGMTKSVNFKTGYNVDFTRNDGSEGKIRGLTSTEINKWCKSAVEAGEVTPDIAKEIKRQIKTL